MKALALRNGVIVDAEIANHRALIYADGVFETLRSASNYRVPMWPWHMQRLQRSARRLHIDLDEALLQNQLDGALRAYPAERALIKILLARKPSTRASYTQGERAADILIFLREFEPRELSGGRKLRSVSKALSTKTDTLGLKTVSRLDYVFASLEQRFEQDEEALFVDLDSHVVETMHHNLFYLQGKKLITPKLKLCGVQGTMRAAILEHFGPQLGFECVQHDFEKELLYKADAVFLCNAIDGLVSATELDGRALKNNKLVKKLGERISREFL
ncbi:aminotransferase class IV [Agaribacterium haliotis]|uniref:aminotransferase class IV n=1 Tax=Agaribacterium haliotis TaxID=2013869 RepID=UPI000BB54B10|nr:aminotransferase class IV [Agaribacterium haliotis]